ILKDISSVITSSFPISFAGIETYKDGQVDFSAISQSFELDQPQFITAIPELQSTLAGEVIRRKTTLILSDAHKNNYQICPSYPNPASLYHYIGVPLIVDGTLSGVLSIATSHHIIVDKETLAWAETIAHHISALLTREAVSGKLKDHENLAANMLNALTSPTMMCSKDGTIIHVNSAFRSIVEVFHSRTIDENSTNIFKLFDNAHQSNSYVHELRARLGDLFKGYSQNIRIDLLLSRAGFHRWYLATMSLMSDGERAIVMFVDISDRKHAEEQLEHEMLHDQSTGLANRILFHDRVNSTLISNSTLDQATCVFALEVGRYAFIVESLGYDAADRIILKVSKRLESIVAPTDLIARVGSSEFAIHIEHIHNADQARDFALNLIDLFRSPFEIDGQEILLKPSVGIALSNPKAQIDTDMFLHDAHAAMTQSRDNVATSYSFASVSRSTLAYKKLKKERELSKAIEENQLVVFYQPEVELLTGRIIGAEALVRWRHPKLGLIQPDSFIDLAEESGLIDSLFDSVFDSVINDAQTLFSNGFDFTIWTNLSAKQFSTNTTTKLISKKVANSDLPPHMFGLEITETAVMENSETASETLSNLKSAGFALALDDFGTGYSSLAYLQSFPVDIIKIDRTFTSELGRTKASNEIVSAVIGLAHGLNLKVLAEGVETPQNELLLRELGCDLAQGYLYAHPLSFSKFLEYLGVK
ncbi:MAG TPA: EAL domain-containing protein, partial [Acidimicrobiia bacterium]|nr:EAL domain-containing protein [Acidimicrobiia bacterium]